MKPFIQKTFSIFISLIFYYILFLSIIKGQETKNLTSFTLNLWIKNVVPSIAVAYICSMFLHNYALLSNLLYSYLFNIFHFENSKALSIFLISQIIGEPTTSLLITKAVENNEITLAEGNRLMRFTSFISPVFLFTILDSKTAIIIIICETITNIIIGIFSKNTYINNKVNSIKPIYTIYFEIVNKLPLLLLGILTSMLLINLVKLCFSSFWFVNFLLEITSGFIILKDINFSYITYLYLCTLLTTTTGCAIIIQTIWLIKNTGISFKNYFKYRMVALIISLILIPVIYLLFKFFF